VLGLDRVAYLVSVKRALAVLTPKIVSWIDQHLCELVRCGQADFVSGAERRPSCKYGSYEYERNRTAFEHLVGDHFLGVFAKGSSLGLRGGS